MSSSGSYRVLTEHACPWKVRQWPDWDAVAETGSFTVKFSALEWRISRSWMDYVKIMESFRLKMEKDSLAIITSSLSVFPSLSLSASLSPSLSCSFTRSVVHAQTHSPFSLYCSVLLLFSVNSRCGNVERNLHRKQSPIRIALFMSRHGAAYKKGENAWIRRRWAESVLTDNMHVLAFTHFYAHEDIHKYTDTHTHACTSRKIKSHPKCPQPPSTISVHLEGYWNKKPLYHLQQRRNKTLKELFQIYP